MTNLKVTYKKTQSLIPYAMNARSHSERQIAQLAASIKEFGFTNPILIDPSGTVVAGHGRLLAAEKLGLEKVPTISLANLTEAQIKAYVIADNNLALNSTWDDDKLMVELERLQEMNFNTDLLGWDELPSFVSTPDYNILGDHDVTDELAAMTNGVRKSIMIDFEPEDYEEAFELVRWWRQRDAYVGYMLLDFLRQEKRKHESH